MDNSFTPKYTFKLPKNAIWREEVTISLITILLATNFLGFAAASSHPLARTIFYVFLATVLIAAPFDILWFAPRRVKNTQLMLTDTSIIIRRGKMFTSTQIVPFSRLTVISQMSNPIAKFFHHSKVVVTATTEEISLPYLSVSDADRLVQLLQEQTSIKPSILE